MDELWSTEDDLQLTRFLRALEAGELVEMLAAIEGLDRRATHHIEAKLAEWGERVYSLLIESDLHEQVDALQQVLVRELGFRGDRQSYQHPYNSQLSRVMTRRRGLPILLACIWSVVGREAGLDVDGVGMPAHFIIRVGGDEGLLVDPFDSGREIDKDDCVEILERIAGQEIVWRDEYLASSTPQQIAIRVLRNLLGAYSRLDDG
ncbi:MAG: transglutaminase family protein, partial [Myxococcales bacterium]|nr:transglutaminase family protein [Myxococcales bacterium]